MRRGDQSDESFSNPNERPAPENQDEEKEYQSIGAARLPSLRGLQGQLSPWNLQALDVSAPIHRNELSRIAQIQLQEIQEIESLQAQSHHSRQAALMDSYLHPLGRLGSSHPFQPSLGQHMPSSLDDILPRYFPSSVASQSVWSGEGIDPARPLHFGATSNFHQTPHISSGMERTASNFRRRHLQALISSQESMPSDLRSLPSTSLHLATGAFAGAGAGIATRPHSENLDTSLTDRSASSGQSTFVASAMPVQKTSVVPMATATKPKRALSAYNLFFKQERMRLLNELPDAAAATESQNEQDQKPAAVTTDGTSPTTPKRNKNPRRRKPHGKITFDNMAKTIASRWKSINPEERVKYQDQANADKVRYQAELQVWKAQQSDALTKQRAALESNVDERIREQYFEKAGSIPPRKDPSA